MSPFFNRDNIGNRRRRRWCSDLIRFAFLVTITVAIVLQITLQRSLMAAKPPGAKYAPTTSEDATISSEPVTSKIGEKSLSLAVVAHPGTVVPATHFIRNMVRGLTTGRDACEISRVLVFYDARKPGPKLDAFLKDLEQLKREHIIHKLVQLDWNTTLMKDVFGVYDPKQEDGPMYATYQYLTQECTTDFCLFTNLDVFAYEGGGVSHAIKAVNDNPNAVFAIPPQVCYDVDVSYSESDKLRQLYHDADGNTPYHLNIGQIRGKIQNDVGTCRAVRGGFSARYYVADPKRFVKVLPLPPSTDSPLLEDHPAIFKQSLCYETRDCRNTGWMVHPPPWHMGNRLLKRCGVEALQKAVNNPEKMVVDDFNNMVEENWTEACIKYL